MNHIGNIIQEYRCRMGLTQKQLAECICSPKYVYLVEKGERTPSTGLLRLLSDKLNVDLCALYRYLDCTNPIEVHDAIVLFEKYKRNSDFKNLKELTDEQKAKPDFIRSPWNYEIEINEYCYAVLVEGKAAESIAGLKKVIQKLTASSYLDYHLAQLYTLLSICYHRLNDTENSYHAAVCAKKLLKNKQRLAHYKQVTVTTEIGFLFTCLQMHRYQSILLEGNKLLEYQLENNLFERIHYTFFLLALANDKLGDKNAAIGFCKKAIYYTLIYQKEHDIKFFIEYEPFWELMNDDQINSDAIAEFRDKYHIDAGNRCFKTRALDV
ncbi:MAG: helix-turn-helix transcriptional regulator [Bacillota bacterium]